ncbi:MAG: hypothetical protein R6W85_10750 [Gillisia sp.]
MKNIFKLTLLSFIGLMVSCSDTDRPVDEVFDGTTRGIVMRTLESSTDLPVGEGGDDFSLLLEIQDGAGGSLADFIEVYVAFQDNTPENGTNPKAEALFQTIPSSAFITGERLPRVAINISLADLEDFFNLTEDDYTGGDRFVVRLELHTTDGRVFTDRNTNAIINGPFYRSPFRYNANVVCPSELEVAFTWVAKGFFLQGTSYGDLGSPTGSDKLVRTTGTTYKYESGFFDFGYYCVFWNEVSPGCGDGASGSLQLADVCGKLTYIGADQFGDAWEIRDVSVNGSNLTFTWESAYGEGSTVTLTRTDGEDWPDNLFSE